MRVVGLDLSLTAVGFAWEGGTITHSSKKRGVERLIALRQQILYDCVCVELVALEGYAYGRIQQAHYIGELGGVIRVALHEHGVPVAEIAPAVLKKYATGRGNAPKGLVLEAAAKRAPIDFDGDDNRADAWWLRQMGLAHYTPDHPDLVVMPANHRDVLQSVPWPDIHPPERSSTSCTSRDSAPSSVQAS